MTVAATTALNRIADALEMIAEKLNALNDLAEEEDPWYATAGIDTEPEQECADVAEARRERHSTHYYGDHCYPPHQEMP